MVRGCTREFETYSMQCHECSRETRMYNRVYNGGPVTRDLLICDPVGVAQICAPRARRAPAPEVPRNRYRGMCQRELSCSYGFKLLCRKAIARERVAPQFLRDVDPGATSARMSSCFAAAPQI